MELFWPDRLALEHDALNYAMGRDVYDRVRRAGIPVEHLPASNRSRTLTAAKTPKQYQAAKRVLVLAVHRKQEFETCRPSADFHLPLAGGCPGACQYCYLASTFEMRPFIRLYVNLEEILAEAADRIRIKAPEITSFEGSSTADTLALEHLGGSVAQCVRFFAGQQHGRFRFVTKFDTVDDLTTTQHNGHTKVRFSINSAHVIRSFEQHTASLEERIAAARKVADAGYPLGFVVAPIIRHDGWHAAYAETFQLLADRLGPHAGGALTFELIQYRFTPKTKRVILAAYPATKLPLEESERQLKPGKFPGAAKYVYPKAEAGEIETYMQMLIREQFPAATIEYFT
ncbi:MAG TPA: spore photoproduct lyase [Symbiobacteriaceae bacterium]|nr:spore photoproduct lyase [Symbiobacteriaceae bacterium]